MKKKLLYWIPTVLILLPMVASALWYFTHIPEASAAFNQLGYPSYVLYFNGIAKILGAIAILFPVGHTLKEWAYAGYLFILLLALQALWVGMPGMIPYPMFGFLAVWGLSYWQFKVQGR